MGDYRWSGVQKGCRRPTDDEMQEITEAILSFEGGAKQTGAVHIDDIRRASVIDITADGTFEAADGVFDFRLTIGPSAGLDFWGEAGDLPVHVEPEPEPEVRLVPSEWTHMSWWLCRNGFAAEKAEIHRLYYEAGNYDDFFQPGGFRAAKAKNQARELAARLHGRLGTVEDWDRAKKQGYDGSGTLDDAHRKDIAEAEQRQALQAAFLEGTSCP